MNGQIGSRRINTGDFVGSAWTASPQWSPYAQAIADHYPIQVPWFQTERVVLSNTPADLSIPVTVVTRPYLYDVLIFGISADQDAPIATAGMAYLNITHQETGIPWVAPGQIGYSPLPAFAGMTSIGSNGSPIMNVMKLPEAFFLPKHTQLKLDWLRSELDVTPDVTIKLTLVGVQLINHSGGFEAPKRVAIPDGEIEVGSRIPWFATIPFGARPDTAASRLFFDYNLNALQQVVQYCPPNDCDVEIHDTYASFLDSTFEFSGSLSLLRTKLDTTRVREDWTPQFTPPRAVFGSLIEINPAMPFPKPELLKTGRKLTITAQNNTTGNNMNEGTVTFRGVRQCLY